MKSSIPFIIAFTIVVCGVEAFADDAAPTCLGETAIVLSFVPGVSYPGDGLDTRMALAMIGSNLGDVDGFDLAGAFSLTKDVHGLEASGIFNSSAKLNGFQSAGFYNAAGDVHGMQLAGIFNNGGELVGYQFASVFNTAGDVRGLQMAGAYNAARDIHGAQVGLVNVADTVDGLQLGLVNLSKNGIERVSALYDPFANYAYMYWESGAPFLFTTIGVGSSISSSFLDGAVASLGLGTSASAPGLAFHAVLVAEQRVGGLPYRDFNFGDWNSWAGFSSFKPYASLKLSVGLPIWHSIQIVTGLKTDIELGESSMPAELKQGRSWSGSVFGESLALWPHWFLGMAL